jgi:hypothetical protein
MSIDQSVKCGICLHDLAGGALSSCATCGTSYHAECFTFNKRKCAVYGCWKSPFPKRPLGPPQRHADIFNPVVLAALILLMLAVFAWNWIRFTGL